MKLYSILELQVVLSPFVHMLSFTAIGTPARVSKGSCLNPSLYL